MSDIKKRAVEHLAEAYRRKGQPGLASLMIEREGRTNNVWGDVALNAIIAALTPPEGYVLVPTVLPEKMLDALYCAEGDMSDDDMQKLWQQLLAARPEVSP